MEKLPEAKQAGGGIIQQPVFWGDCMCHLLTESTPRLLRGNGFAERTGWGSGEMPASSRSRGARGSGWLGMGRGSRKEKPLTLDLFHILPNIKLFSPFNHIAPRVLWLPLFEPKCVLSTRQGL